MTPEGRTIRPWATLVGAAALLLVPVAGAAGSGGDPGGDPARAPRRIKVVPADASDYDGFGGAISGAGPAWVIAAPGDDDLGTAAGAAYVYEVDAEGNGHETKLLPSGAEPLGRVGDGNGAALHGDTVILGAPNVAGFTGAAWVFERRAPGEWVDTQEIRPSDGVEDLNFGYGVVVEGGVAVIGAPASSAERPGSIYAYERDGGALNGGALNGGALNGGAWIERQRLFASDGELDDRFGEALDLDGDLLVVGAPHDTAPAPGRAYVFRRGPDGLWAQEAKLEPAFQLDNDFYGIAVAIDAGRVLVGASHEPEDGAAYLFERDDTGAWAEVAKLLPDDGGFADDFGGAVALRGDLAVVGDLGNIDLGQSAGAVFAFQRQVDGTWSRIARLLPPGGEPWDLFGAALAMDDHLLLVGSPGSGRSRGSVWVYRLP